MFEIVLISLFGLCFILERIYPLNYQGQGAWIPLAIAAASAFGSIWASRKASKAAEKAGKEQAKIANKQLKFAKEFEKRQRADREKAFEYAKGAAAPSPQELANLEKMTEANDKRYQDALAQIDKYDDLLDQVDPIMKETGDQTLQLLRGEQSKILQPAMKIRQQQRDAYMNQLAARLGPGFRTTSAGIMAMNKFDSDTEMQMVDIQNQALTNVSAMNQSYIGASEGIRRNVAGLTDSANQNRQLGIGATQDVLGNFKQREQQAINAFMGMPVSNEGAMSAYSNLTGVVGNKYVGDISFNNSLANMFGQIGGIGLGMTAAQYAQKGNLDEGETFDYYPSVSPLSIAGPYRNDSPQTITTQGSPVVSQGPSSRYRNDNQQTLASTYGGGRSTGVGGYWANKEKTIPYDGTIGYGRGFYV